MSKIIDFDRFIGEKNHETIDVKIFGKTYKVPKKIPASVPVMMARAGESPDTQASTRMVMSAADAMLGKKVVDEICEKGLSAIELSELVQMLFKSINGGDEEEDDETEEYSDDAGKKVATGKREKK